MVIVDRGANGGPPPVPPQAPSSAIASPASRTLATKVALIKSELDLPQDASVASAVADANKMLDLAPKGSIRTQVDAILAQLEPQANVEEEKTVTASVNAEPEAGKPVNAEPEAGKRTVEWAANTEEAAHSDATGSVRHHAARPSLTDSRTPSKVVKQLKLKRSSSFSKSQSRYRLQLMKEVTKRLKLGLKLSRIARCQLIEQYTPEPILINIGKLEEVINIARKLEQRIGSLPETAIAQKRLKEARKAKADVGKLEARLKEVVDLLAERQEPTIEDCELLQQLIALAEKQGWDVQREQQTLEALLVRRKAFVERNLAALAPNALKGSGQHRRPSVPELQKAIRDAKEVCILKHQVLRPRALSP